LPQTVGLSQAFKVFVHKANAAENIPDAHVLIVMYFSPNMGVQDVRFLSENQNHRPACGKKSLTLKIVKNTYFWQNPDIMVPMLRNEPGSKVSEI